MFLKSYINPVNNNRRLSNYHINKKEIKEGETDGNLSHITIRKYKLP